MAHQATSRTHPDLAPRDATADLLLAATRRLCEADRPSREDLELYREAFYAAVHRLDTATRQSVATLLSRTPYCPRPIALFLAMDVPAVSHSMLKHSPVLGERDLEQIVARTTPIHVRLVAARPHICDALVERIAAFDDPDIRSALLANPTLVLDETMRDRLSPAQAGPLRRTVTASAPRIAEPDLRDEEERGRETLKAALARTRPDRNRTPRSRDDQDGMLSGDADDFRATFEAAAMKRDRKAMVEAMRARFGLTHGTAIQALDDRTGDALQVMMKAEGFDAAQAHRIVMLAIPAVGLSPAASERARTIWERLQPETCRKAFAAWPRDERPARGSAPHEPIHAEADGVRRETRRANGQRVTVNRHALTG